MKTPSGAVAIIPQMRGDNIYYLTPVKAPNMPYDRRRFVRFRGQDLTPREVSLLRVHLALGHPNFDLLKDAIHAGGIRMPDDEELTKVLLV